MDGLKKKKKLKKKNTESYFISAWSFRLLKHNLHIPWLQFSNWMSSFTTKWQTEHIRSRGTSLIKSYSQPPSADATIIFLFLVINEFAKHIKTQCFNWTLCRNALVIISPCHSFQTSSQRTDKRKIQRKSWMHDTLLYRYIPKIWQC